jgi:hypothetical protein
VTTPPGTDAAPDEPATVRPRPKVWIGLLPILVAVVTIVAVQLHTLGTIGVMIFPAVGFTITGITLLGNAAGIAVLFRWMTGQWHPLVSIALALFTALAYWLPVVAPVPMLYGALSAIPVLLGAAVGALAMLALPARWRVAGAISAAIIAVALIVPWLV